MPDTPVSSSLVEFKDVTFSYPGSVGDRVILDRMSLTVPRGKVTAIMGASGGGKTTVLRLIGGQQKANKGQVLFDGQDIGALAQPKLYAARRRMGMLFQFGALFTDLSVFDNVAFPLREHTALSEALVRDIVLMKLNAVGLRGARVWRAAWPWRAPWCWTPNSSCMTSLSPGWTPFRLAPPRS